MKNLIESYKDILRRRRSTMWGICLIITVGCIWAGLYNNLDMLPVIGIAIAALIIGFVAAIIPASDKMTKKKLEKLMKSKDIQMFYETIDDELENKLYVSAGGDDGHFALTHTWVICLSYDRSIIRRRNEIVSCDAKKIPECGIDALIIRFTNGEIYMSNCGPLNDLLAESFGKYVAV